MSIVKIVKRDCPYVTIDKTGIDDPNLSWGATGLLTYLIGRPSNWKISIAHLSKVKKCRETATKSVLKELREFNYCHYFVVRKNGKISETFYLVFEVPTDSNEILDHIESYIDIKDVKKEDIIYQTVRNEKRCYNKKPQVENQLLENNIENKDVLPQVDFPQVENLIVENQGLLNKDYTNNRITNNKTTTEAKKEGVKNSSSFLEKFSIGKEVEKEEINQKLISLSFSKMTRKNIIKLYSNNLVDKNRIFEVLEFSKDKNWGEGAVYSALKENWNTKKVENKETKQIEMRKANEEKEREKRLERAKEEEKIRKTNERIDNTIKEFKKLPEAKQIEITTIAEERYISKHKVNKDFFDMTKKNTPLLYLNILFSELIELLKEKNYSFAFATV